MRKSAPTRAPVLRRDFQKGVFAISSATGRGRPRAASVPNFLCQEQVSLGEGYLREPFQVKQGHVAIPIRPGVVVKHDENLIADAIGHEGRNPETCFEKDGSVVDW